MKKQVLWLCAGGAIVCALGAEVMTSAKHSLPKPPVLKVSYFWNGPATDLDPAVISYANSAVLLDNLYSNLATYDGQGNLVSDLATSFHWNGKSYIFRFGPEKKTSKGE